MAVDIRRPLHNAVISGLTNLKHVNNTDYCFAAVQKVYTDIPVSLPAAQVMPTETTIDVRDMSYDESWLGYEVQVYDYIEASTTSGAAADRVDRLEDIEDRVREYIDQVPVVFANVVSGVEVYDSKVQQARYSFEAADGGIQCYLFIDFSLKIDFNVRT